MFKQLITALMLTIILSSCSAVNTQSEINNSAFNMHPDWPSSIKPDSSKDWSIIEVEDQNYVALPFSQYLDFLENQQDILRYIEQSNQIICYYRKELDESKCSTYNTQYNHSEGINNNAN